MASAAANASLSSALEMEEEELDEVAMRCGSGSEATMKRRRTDLDVGGFSLSRSSFVASLPLSLLVSFGCRCAATSSHPPSLPSHISWRSSQKAWRSSASGSWTLPPRTRCVHSFRSTSRYSRRSRPRSRGAQVLELYVAVDQGATNARVAIGTPTGEFAQLVKFQAASTAQLVSRLGEVAAWVAAEEPAFRPESVKGACMAAAGRVLEGGARYVPSRAIHDVAIATA